MKKHILTFIVLYIGLSLGRALLGLAIRADYNAFSMVAGFAALLTASQFVKVERRLYSKRERLILMVTAAITCILWTTAYSMSGLSMLVREASSAGYPVIQAVAIDIGLQLVLAAMFFSPLYDRSLKKQMGAGLTIAAPSD